MNVSAPFIARPVATALLTLAIALAGILGFCKLPISLLPQVDFPTISVTAQLPGASPATVATTLAAPLERHLGQIADVTEMTSRSVIGQTAITLQFDVNRDINGAARDVEAAINAARAELPANLPGNPIYRKFNPTEAPDLILALTSKTLTQGQMYDAASNLLAQRLSQLSGIGNVIISGSTMPAVRVELSPYALYKYGIGLEDVRAALASANANSPKGTIDDGRQRYQIYTNDQANVAADYAPLVIAYRNGAAVRLSDVAEVEDSVEDVRNLGMANGQPSILIQLFRQPNANTIATIENVKAELPHLEAAIPADINVTIVSDGSATIRASLRDTELTLVLAALLVTIVVYVFLRNLRAMVFTSIAVPISIFGTFGAMYLLGYNIDVLSLTALTIATGFVVDDAIVVLENISRHLEKGMPRMEAVSLGAREVGFTVLAISLSLIAVFIPILLMGGILGRLFREFTVTLSIAILLSLLISLTTTPMLCALFLRRPPAQPPEHRPVAKWLMHGYSRTLSWALRHNHFVLLTFIGTICLNVALFVEVPKGLFPQQDTGRIYGWLETDQGISFRAISEKLRQVMAMVQQDPAVENTVGFTGAGSGWGGSSSTGAIVVSLKSLSERASADQVIARLRPKLAQVPSGRLYLGVIQDINVGVGHSNSQYQYALLSENVDDLYNWVPKLIGALQHNSVLTDVSSDQQQRGLETYLDIDRDGAARLGISPLQIDNTLYDAFGQRQVSVIYSAANQYHVVMEVDPRYSQYPDSLRDVYVSTSAEAPPGTALSNAPEGMVTAVPGNARSAPVTKSGGSATSSATKGNGIGSTAANKNLARNVFTNAIATSGKGPTSTGAAVSTAMETMIPLAAVSHYRLDHTPLSVNHQGLLVASTISFALQPGRSLSEAANEIKIASARIHMPAAINGTFTGTAQLSQQSIGREPLLIIAALAIVYILLGALYESYVHPLTILSTLPSAGVGAIFALMLFHMQFDIMGLIGVILLIGIVKKNAIMMIDVAIEAKRSPDLSARDAIFEACLLRFRPIMMTTTAAIFGAVPLAVSFGSGGEIRRPLGISIMGGLIVSQILTLYTTPVLFLYMDRISHWSIRQRHRFFPTLFRPPLAS